MYLCMETFKMNTRFDALFMVEAREFPASIDQKSRNKILYTIDKAKLRNDNELFKKLNGEIWEFSTFYNRKKFRLFAFWDQSG